MGRGGRGEEEEEEEEEGERREGEMECGTVCANLTREI